MIIRLFINIGNNRSFFCDSMTEGWTKKDWALNLIPLNKGSNKRSGLTD